MTGSFSVFTALGGAGKEIGFVDRAGDRRGRGARTCPPPRDRPGRRGRRSSSAGGRGVGDYRDRAVTAALPPLGDPSHVTRRVVDAVAGFGPLQPFLDDPEIEEIWINEPGRVFVARRGRSQLTTLIPT